MFFVRALRFWNALEINYYYYYYYYYDYFASLYNYAQNYVGLKWTALSDARFISDFDSSLVYFSVFHLIYFSVSVLFV